MWTTSSASSTCPSSPTSPYLPLLKRAQCEYGDIVNAVRHKGLEPALLDLRDAGVYVSFEEFKGRKPIVRGDLVLEATPSDFDNPVLRRGFYTQTSGSTGRSIPSWVSLDYMENRMPSTVLNLASKGVLGAPTVIWRETMPGPGVILVLEDVRAGQPYDHWFAPPLRRSVTTDVTSRVATELVVLAARRSGARVPRPQPLDYDRGVVVARWAERRIAGTGVCLVRAGISNSLRVATAAAEAGIDLSGATFVGAGEPASPAKARVIESVGGNWMSGYAINEVGRVGTGCARPLDSTDVHFLKHASAIVPYPREVPGTGQTVDAFNFTSILPGSPKVLLNAELDDYGILETRSCGCLIEEAGLTEHIRQIFSFSKLTGEGVTLMGNDLLHVLEDVLPRRFGGSAVDYQLVEEEDAGGFTKLVLIVGPAVTFTDAKEVVDALLAGLGTSGLARDVRAIWQRAKSMEVRRGDPRVNLGGKVRPLLGRSVER